MKWQGLSLLKKSTVVGNVMLFFAIQLISRHFNGCFFTEIHWNIVLNICAQSKGVTPKIFLTGFSWIEKSCRLSHTVFPFSAILAIKTESKSNICISDTVYQPFVNIFSNFKYFFLLRFLCSTFSNVFCKWRVSMKIIIALNSLVVLRQLGTCYILKVIFMNSY